MKKELPPKKPPSRTIISDFPMTFTKAKEGNLKDPIDICTIKKVYKAMIDYRNCTNENQQTQLAASCKLIKTILINSFE